MYRTPPQSQALQYGLAAVLSISPTVFVCLRFRARRLKKVALQLDWLVVFALVFTYLTAVFMIIGTARGSQGQHMRFLSDMVPDFGDARYVWFLKMLYAGQLSQIFTIGPTKLSVLFFYRRIFRGTVFDLVTWSLIALVAAWITAFFSANLLECTPISTAFVQAPGLGLAHCIDAIPMYLSQVYSDVILDAFILVVPLPLIWNLHLPTKQKMAVIGIFLLGIITVAASCARMIIFNYVGHELERRPDVSYELTPIVYWPLIEASLQIIAACLPMLRPIVNEIRAWNWIRVARTRRRKSYELSNMAGQCNQGSQTHICYGGDHNRWEWYSVWSRE